MYSRESDAGYDGVNSSHGGPDFSFLIEGPVFWGTVTIIADAIMWHTYYYSQKDPATETTQP